MQQDKKNKCDINIGEEDINYHLKNYVCILTRNVTLKQLLALITDTSNVKECRINTCLNP